MTQLWIKIHMSDERSYVLSKIFGIEIFHNIMLVKKKKKNNSWCVQTSVDIGVAV